MEIIKNLVKQNKKELRIKFVGEIVNILKARKATSSNFEYFKKLNCEVAIIDHKKVNNKQCKHYTHFQSIGKI